MGYVCIDDGHGCYTVGFYDPQGHWQPDSDHGSAVAARRRVQELDGCRARNAARASASNASVPPDTAAMSLVWKPRPCIQQRRCSRLKGEMRRRKAVLEMEKEKAQ